MAKKADRARSAHFHAVRFYKDAESLCRIVGNFLAEGVVSALPAVVIATPTHRAGITSFLATQSIDVAALESRGQMVMLDAWRPSPGIS